MPGTRADAIAAAEHLASFVRARGVTVSVEVQEGVAGSGWVDPDGKQGVLAHHTVSRRSQGLTPVLALCKRGRPDVPGPLCNGYMGYDHVFRIITMAWANHPGAGGPLRIGNVVVPRNQGRPYLWGTEFEGGLDPADFTPAYRDAMARAHLGVLEYYGLTPDAHGEHSTWAPGRKVDRLGYTTTRGRDELRAVAAALTPEDDVTPEQMDALVARVAEAVWRFPSDRTAPNGTAVPMDKEVSDTKTKLERWEREGRVPVTTDLPVAELGEIDTAGLAAAIAEDLVPRLPSALGVLPDGTLEAIATAVADELARRAAE